MKFILGKKLEMSQLFKEDGTVVPVTIVRAGPCQVTQVRTHKKDGYQAFQVGFEKKKRLNKPVGGHLKGLPKYRHLIEFRIDSSNKPQTSSNILNEKMGDGEMLKRGDKITVDVFELGDRVKVTGVSKGKGFQGVVKRHGFHGSPASHGHKDQLRMPGSIGTTDAARVFPGKRMAGRMGGEQVTVSNLEVAKVDGDKGFLYIKGAVPGARNSLLKISGEGEMELGLRDVRVAGVVEDVEAADREEKEAGDEIDKVNKSINQ